MNFEQFWTDKRIPREMKRCGRPVVEKALAKSRADPEEILRSLPLYASGKPDNQDFCHLSTYINQERYEIWLDPEQQSNPFSERLTATQALERNNVVKLKGV